MIGIDTNIFLYMYDDDEPVKQAKAQNLILHLNQNQAFLILWQVAVEFTGQIYRWRSTKKISQFQFEYNLKSFLKLASLSMPSANVLAHGLKLADCYSLSHWDSLLVAACLEAGVTTLYSEDTSHEAHYDTVQVLNPFLLPSSNQP